MRQFMPDFIGNSGLKSRLYNKISDGKLSHAYIIEGSPGSGRHLLALNIIMSSACLYKSDDPAPLPCGMCEACRKISSGISPDVITIRRNEDKAGIGVESARTIRNNVRTLPNDLDIKAYIIEEADKLTVQAQNALLLTLEEPPSFAVFFLICERSENMLETIRSRAPTIRTELISNDTMHRFLCEKAKPSVLAEVRRLMNEAPTMLDEIIIESDGCIGKAYELLNDDKRALLIEARALIRKTVEAMLDGSPFGYLYECLMLFPQKRDELSDRLDKMILALRDLAVLKKSEDAELCFYSDREAALELAEKSPMSLILKCIQKCENAIDALSHNANVRLTLTMLASKSTHELI